MIQRNILHQIAEAMTDTPVIVINGARQTGKSTLVQGLTQQRPKTHYLSLDDATTLAAATNDPTGFLAGIDGAVILDEVQRAPELFLAIKVEVDRNRTPGRFLLTGSADVLLLPTISESLAGRVEIITLWPFSAGELAGRKESFIDRAFSREPFAPQPGTETRTQLLARMVKGGYPEIVSRTAARIAHWFEGYITAILQRDVRDYANLEQLTLMPRLLRLLAARSTVLLNYAEISRGIGLPQSTLKRYMALLELTYLIQHLPPWSTNLGKRLVKSPKILFADTGLLSFLLNINSPKEIPDTALGPLVEDFVIMELRKQLGWNDTRAQFFHYRDQSGSEIDLIMENRGGDIVAIEIKASNTVTPHDLKAMKALRNIHGDRFVRGLVLYLGTAHVAFDPTLAAVPISALWA